MMRTLRLIDKVEFLKIRTAAGAAIVLLSICMLAARSSNPSYALVTGAILYIHLAVLVREKMPGRPNIIPAKINL